jgi:peroxiredoxin
MHKQVACLNRYLPDGGCFYIPLFLLLLSAQPPAALAQPPAKTVPVFRFATMDHRVFADTDLPGNKLLLFVFFDPDCEHCQHALQTMNRDCQSFQRAAIYLVSAASHDRINRFMASYAPRLAAQKNVFLLMDETSQFITRFNPIRYPSLYLYSTDKSLLDYEDNEGTIFRIEKYTR